MAAATTPSASPMHVQFKLVSAELENQAQLREQIREAVRVLEMAIRSTQGILSQVHGATEAQLLDVAKEASLTFEPIQQAFSGIAELIQPGSYYKHCDMFSRSTQSAAYVIIMTDWLATGNVPDKNAVAEQLGIHTYADRLKLPTEDYLHALITFIGELSRLAPNAVTNGAYALPTRISKLTKELAAGFALLNLKNDSLRRRFDAIKYDQKRIEEVVYDISLRGFVVKEDAAKRQRMEE